MILTRHLEELANFFYHYYGMTLRPFTLLKFEQEERARGGTDLLIASFGPRVVDDTWGNRGCEDNSSETNNISHELNEAVDIDVVIGSGCNKHKTSTGVICINSFSNEEESGAQLEHHRTRRVNHGGPVVAVTPIYSSPAASLPTIPRRAHRLPSMRIPLSPYS
ncbi:hypothetical protein GOBAR_DD03278 [Gossypium barbadense]|nr:hypothetical protein GOBAR_DD03278 [Gossypium barbadense]